MIEVEAIILHARATDDAGPLAAAFEQARRANADRQVAGFRAVGAAATIVPVGPGLPFGRRLRELRAEDPDRGLIVLGSGSIPLATDRDRRELVAAAAAPGRTVLVNNRYSADVLALPPGVDLRALPDLDADNAVPRWLAAQGIAVADRRRRWWLQVDLDSPIDVHVAGLADPTDPDLDRVRATIGAVRRVTADPGREVLVAGRTSAATVRWLETSTAARTRAFVEERGLRTARPDQRPARSILGLALDARGPGSLGDVLAELADAAIVDTRVLIAHRSGADERAWPAAEDRFASDLLMPAAIADPWLRELTAAAASAPIPVLLGAHTLVGPGLRALLDPDLVPAVASAPTATHGVAPAAR